MNCRRMFRCFRSDQNPRGAGSARKKPFATDVGIALSDWRWAESQANRSHRRIPVISEICREFETFPPTCRHRHFAESELQRGLQADPLIYRCKRNRKLNRAEQGNCLGFTGKCWVGSEVTPIRRPKDSTAGPARACSHRYRESRPSAHVAGQLPR